MDTTGSALLFGGGAVWSKLLTTAVVLILAAVNIAGATFIDRIQTVIVVVLVVVFAAFIVATLVQFDPGLLPRPPIRPPRTSSTTGIPRSPSLPNPRSATPGT